MMVNHRVVTYDLDELNGHTGHIVRNLSTGRASLVCSTCPGANGRGGLCLDDWNPRQRAEHPLAWLQHADPLNHPAVGQRYEWRGLTYVVTRVSEVHRWAHIRVIGELGWTKRQPLPLPAGSVLVKAGGSDG